MLTRIPAALLGIKLNTVLYGIIAACVAAVIFIAVVKPRMALSSAKTQLTQRTLERDTALNAVEAYKVENEANKLIAMGTAAVAKASSDARQEAAVKAKVREVQTTVIRDRIIERAAKSDDLVDDGTDTFLDDLGESK